MRVSGAWRGLVSEVDGVDGVDGVGGWVGVPA